VEINIMPSKIAISDTFLESLDELPRKERTKVIDFFHKFRNNPNSPGINFEKIKGTQDGKMRSVRITGDFRAVLVQYQDTYLLLFVGRHDQAYHWAEHRKCEINPYTNALQVYETTVVPENVAPEAPAAGIFSELKENDLLAIGVPPDQIGLVRGLSDLGEFINSIRSFPKDVFESLHMIATGTGTVSEVIDLLKRERQDELQLAKQAAAVQASPEEPAATEAEEEVVPADDLPEAPTEGALPEVAPEEAPEVAPEALDITRALESNTSRMSFYIVGDEKDLNDIMTQPLEKWRTFLHRTQTKIVTKNYNGPVRILGGAGTGKTVVALHRARFLAQNIKDGSKILFTTFTANLAADIRELLRKLCSVEELKKIEVVNLDAYVSEFLRLQGYPFSIVYDDKLKEIWQEAISLSGRSGFSEAFCMDEWSKVVAFNDAYTRVQYLRASRVGRGTRLDRKSRGELFDIFDEYRTILQEKKVRDIETALYECRLIADKNKKGPYYSSIVVDEGQDFSMNAFRFIRSLAGPERPNDIFIVGDTHQRIYKHKVVLGNCGINVRGRSSYLRLNYRTTEETRKFAFALLKGLSFDDLDAGTDAGISQSLTHSDPPEVRHFKNASLETNFIADTIQELSKAVSLSDICLVARTKKHLAGYAASLTEKGIRVFEIMRSRSDDRRIPGVRLATMHRVKGLEFQYMFVASANFGVIPLQNAIDHTDKVTEEETTTSEKCLLYVALTRARQKAFITSYGKPSEFLETA
jgi:mRNA-degrading endonuclease RelE of RelBE toxin-antitoxin system